MSNFIIKKGRYFIKRNSHLYFFECFIYLNKIYIILYNNSKEKES